MSARRAFLYLAMALPALELSACASDGPLRFYGGCERPSDSIRLEGSPLSVAEVEAEPFNALASDWQKLKSKMKPGDELYKFSGSEKHPGYGYTWSGYALMRQGCVVGTITTDATSFG